MEQPMLAVSGDLSSTKTAAESIFCEMCKIALNSTSQAEAHCRGQLHMFQLKQLGLPLPPEVDLSKLQKPKKKTKKTTAEKRSAVNASDRPPVQTVTFSDTDTNCGPANKPITWTCTLCKAEMNSQQQTDAHYAGQRHQNRVALAEQNGMAPPGMSHTGPRPRKSTHKSGQFAQTSFNNTPFMYSSMMGNGAAQSMGGYNMGCSDAYSTPYQSTFNHVDRRRQPGGNVSTGDSRLPGQWRSNAQWPGRQRAKVLIACDICKLLFNSDSQAQMHFQGTKHLKRLKAIALQFASQLSEQSVIFGTKKTATKRSPGAGVQTKSDGADNGTVDKSETDNVVGKTAGSKLHCELCNIDLNSERQLQDHVQGQMHQNKLNGVVKPKKKAKKSAAKTQLDGTNGLSADGTAVNATLHAGTDDGQTVF